MYMHSKKLCVKITHKICHITHIDAFEITFVLCYYNNELLLYLHKQIRMLF